MTETEKRLIQLTSKRFGKEETEFSSQDDFFEKLGINSYQALELLSALESEFAVEIPDYELADVKTFSGLAQVIDRRR